MTPELAWDAITLALLLAPLPPDGFLPEWGHEPPGALPAASQALLRVCVVLEVSDPGEGWDDADGPAANALAYANKLNWARDAIRRTRDCPPLLDVDRLLPHPNVVRSWQRLNDACAADIDAAIEGVLRAHAPRGDAERRLRELQELKEDCARKWWVLRHLATATGAYSDSPDHAPARVVARREALRLLREHTLVGAENYERSQWPQPVPRLSRGAEAEGK